MLVSQAEQRQSELPEGDVEVDEGYESEVEGEDEEQVAGDAEAKGERFVKNDDSELIQIRLCRKADHVARAEYGGSERNDGESEGAHPHAEWARALRECSLRLAPILANKQLPNPSRMAQANVQPFHCTSVKRVSTAAEKSMMTMLMILLEPETAPQEDKGGSGLAKDDGASYSPPFHLPDI